MTINDHAVTDPASPFLTKLTIGKAEVEYRKQAMLFTFTDTSGQRRQLDDPTGNIARLIETILEGSGKLEPSKVTVYDHKTGLPPTNLHRVGASQLQRPYETGTTVIDGQVMPVKNPAPDGKEG